MTINMSIKNYSFITLLLVSLKMAHTSSTVYSSGPSTSTHNSLSKFSSDSLFHSRDFSLFMWLNGFSDSTKSPTLAKMSV